MAVYGSFWNDPAAASAMFSLLDAVPRDADTPYVPEWATLVSIDMTDGRPDRCKRADTELQAILARAIRPRRWRWASAVSGKDLDVLMARLGGSMGDGFFCTKTRRYSLALVPWLPGADHHAAIARWQAVAE